MGSKKKNNKKPYSGNGGGGETKMIEDSRFSIMQTDPKFKKLPKHKAKVELDSRFSGIFKEKRFAGSSAPQDKRGKPKKKGSESQNALKRYYRQDEEEGKEREKSRKRKEIEESESEDEEEEEKEGKAEARLDETDTDTGTDTDSDEMGTGTDTETDTDRDDGDALQFDGVEGDEDEEEKEEVPTIDEETNKLAVVDLDWSQLRAVDLFVVLKSFLPKQGKIKSVTVYPSDFGMQRMQEEAVSGPVGLFDDEDKDDDDEDDDDELDPAKLRAYEKSRLRYYYAVVECDSVATASHLYEECNGLEFERSSNVLDLRFIPDSVEFKHPPRDFATEAPSNYDGLDFETKALRQSKLTLSWDDDEPNRRKVLRRTYDDKQLAELELNELLASDESDSDSDEDEDEDADEDKNENPSEKKNKKVEKYRALLQSGDGSEEENDEGQEMEVTFNTGLEDLSTKILEKKAKGSETVWEAYLRKRKEKKGARKNRSKNSSDDSDESDEGPAELVEDFFEEEPSDEEVKGGGRGKKKREEVKLLADKEAEASRAELELLLADENGADNKVKGYKIKQSKSKGKKGKEALDEDKLPSVDLEDPRLSALFNDPAFALDPTDPQFKRSATYFRQLAKQQQKSQVNHADEEPAGFSRDPSSNSAKKEEKNSSQMEKYELSSLVRSLKMKSKQLPAPSTGKTKNVKAGSNGATFKEKKHKDVNPDQPKKKKAKL